MLNGVESGVKVGIKGGAEKDRMGAVPHGFRSSFRTWAAERSGASSDAAELVLAHNVGNATTRSYLRTDLLEERATMMQQWADFLDSVVSLCPRGRLASVV